ncbi:hypothetical protein CTI12_AA470090 [Artemisia annua]|uniref:Uncharacterized protein n=1 Tax=Artemisia annua TaxID=35608 RepID=A0A2U1LNT1_ARTAN|nr:hypothetical protein CTI12_AA470090 [Artemisia annua]
MTCKEEGKIQSLENDVNRKKPSWKRKELRYKRGKWLLRLLVIIKVESSAAHPIGLEEAHIARSLKHICDSCRPEIFLKYFIMVIAGSISTENCDRVGIDIVLFTTHDYDGQYRWSSSPHLGLILPCRNVSRQLHVCEEEPDKKGVVDQKVKPELMYTSRKVHGMKKERTVQKTESNVQAQSEVAQIN